MSFVAEMLIRAIGRQLVRQFARSSARRLLRFLNTWLWYWLVVALIMAAGAYILHVYGVRWINYRPFLLPLVGPLFSLKLFSF